MAMKGQEREVPPGALQYTRNFASAAHLHYDNPPYEEPLSTVDPDSPNPNLFCICEHWCFATRSKFNFEDIKGN